MGEVPEKEVTCIKQVIEEQKQGIDEAIAINFFYFFLWFLKFANICSVFYYNIVIIKSQTPILKFKAKFV